MLTISTAFTGIKTAIDIAKALRNSEVSLEKAELKLQLADLMSALADAKMSVIEVEDLIREKDLEIDKLNEALKIKKKLVRNGEAYYETDEDGKLVGDPYCSYCFEIKHVAVHLKKILRLNVRSECPACKNEYSLQQSFEINK